MRYVDTKGVSIREGQVLKLYKKKKSIKTLVESHKTLKCLVVRKILKNGELSQHLFIPLKDAYKNADKIVVMKTKYKK